MIVRENVTDASGRAIEIRRAAADDERAQLVHEAAMLALARHPGVVEIVRADPDGAELVTSSPSASLAELAGRPDAWLGAVAAVAETVADLHALGIVHGDLTAEAIRVSEAGRPVLTGFAKAGLAGDDRGAGGRLRPSTDVEALARLAGQALAPAAGSHGVRRTGPSELARLLEAGEQGNWPPARRLARAIEAERPSGPTDPFARLRPPTEEARPRPARFTALAALAGLIGAAAVTWGGLHLAWPDATDHRPPAPSAAGLPRSSVDRPASSTPPRTDAGLVAPAGVVTVGRDHYEIDSPGDVVLVADWGCRGPDPRGRGATEHRRALRLRGLGERGPSAHRQPRRPGRGWVPRDHHPRRRRLPRRRGHGPGRSSAGGAAAGPLVRTSARPVVRLGGLAVVLAGALAIVVLGGRRVAAPPPTVSSGRWSAWLARVGPAGVVMGLVRAVVVAVLVYLLALVLIEIAGRLAGARGLLRAASHASLPCTAVLVQRVAGVGLAASIAAGIALHPTPADAAGTPSSTPVMQRLDPPAATAEPPVMRRLDDPPPTPPVELPPAPIGPTSPASWTIRPGDHLWGVATHTLIVAWGRPPSDREILAYVHAVVQANEQVFVVPGDADLVYPGQQFVLPAVGPA